MEKLNPATKPEQTDGERARIPMSVPVQLLETPDIPGFHLHWMMNNVGRIQQAQNAGYEFVTQDEIKLQNTSLGGDSAASGNTDLGSRVSVVSGTDTGEDGQAVRLVLMKLREEFWIEAQQLVEDRNMTVRDALVGGMTEGTPGDTEHRYVDKSRSTIPDFFKRKGAKAP